MTSVTYTTVGAVVVIFVLAAVVVSVARSIIGRVLARLEVVSADNRAAVQARGRQLGRALTLLAYGVAALASISLALSRVGIGEPRWNPGELGRWLTTHGINVVVIITGAWVVVRAANLAIEHLQFKLGRHHVHTDLEWQRRAATLSGILTSMVTATVGFVAILGLVLAWGTMQWRRMSARQKQRRDEATRDQYR